MTDDFALFADYKHQLASLSSTTHSVPLLFIPTWHFSFFNSRKLLLSSTLPVLLWMQLKGWHLWLSKFYSTTNLIKNKSYLCIKALYLKALIMMLWKKELVDTEQSMNILGLKYFRSIIFLFVNRNSHQNWNSHPIVYLDYVDAKKQSITFKYSLIITILHREYFSHCCSKAFTPQVQPSFKFKKIAFSGFSFRRPLK